jgi:hypothetical protein
MNTGAPMVAAKSRQTLDELSARLAHLADVLASVSEAADQLVLEVLGPTAYGDPRGKGEDQPSPQGLLGRCFYLADQAMEDLNRVALRLSQLRRDLGSSDPSEPTDAAGFEERLRRL